MKAKKITHKLEKPKFKAGDSVSFKHNGRIKEGFVKRTDATQLKVYFKDSSNRGYNWIWIYKTEATKLDKIVGGVVQLGISYTVIVFTGSNYITVGCTRITKQAVVKITHLLNLKQNKKHNANSKTTSNKKQ